MDTHSCAPISNGSISSGDRLSLSIHALDAKIASEPIHRPSKPKTFPPIRLPGATTKISRKSRRNLTFLIRNVPDYSQFLTLSYGNSAPKDDKLVKKHLDRICTWLIRQGISLVWRQDWTKTGHVHFHMLLSGTVNTTELRRKWVEIAGLPERSNFSVHMNAIRNQESVRKYLVKPASSRSNFVPENYRNMGRFWGARGLHKPAVQSTFVGTRTELGPLTRIIRKIVQRRTGRKIFFSQDHKSFTLWNGGGIDLANGLMRYWNRLGPASSG